MTQGDLLLEGVALPELPAGYTSQPTASFRDDHLGFDFELALVYTPAGRLRQDLSYWLVTYPVFRAGEPDQPESRWLPFSMAAALLGRGVAFDEFASPVRMRERLPALLLRERAHEAVIGPGFYGLTAELPT